MSEGSTFLVLNLRVSKYEFLLYKSNFFADYFLSGKNSDRQEVAFISAENCCDHVCSDRL